MHSLCPIADLQVIPYFKRLVQKLVLDTQMLCRGLFVAVVYFGLLPMSCLTSLYPSNKVKQFVL